MDLQFGNTLFAVVTIVLGAVVCCAGYRYLPKTLVACGFLFPGLLVALVIGSAFDRASWIETGCWVGFLVAGAIGALLASVFYEAGLCLCGLGAGTVLSFTIDSTLVNHFSTHPSKSVLLLTMVSVLGIGFGVLTVKLKRSAVIVMTSFIGAEMAVFGVGYFAGSFPMGTKLKFYHHTSQPQDHKAFPVAYWGYLAAIVVLFVTGLVLQVKWTAKNLVHRRTDSLSEESPVFVDPQTRNASHFSRLPTHSLPQSHASSSKKKDPRNSSTFVVYY